jgi:prepilin-type processing-associated H-X9-DG protein
LLHQRYKDILFLMISKATLPGYWFHRFVIPPKSRNGAGLHLHLGCGPKYLQGFVNIDANPLRRIDLWLDVRNGLPFRSDSVDSIYSTHVLEHLYPDELKDVLRESARVLKRGCGTRIVVPSLSNAILAYNQKNVAWFSEFPRHYESPGGRFSNFLFCDGQHRTAFDCDYMREMLSSVGFSEVVEVRDGESRLYGANVPRYEAEDGSNSPHSLYIEAFK